MDHHGEEGGEPAPAIRSISTAGPEPDAPVGWKQAGDETAAADAKGGRENCSIIEEHDHDAAGGQAGKAGGRGKDAGGKSKSEDDGEAAAKKQASSAPEE